MRLVVRFRVPTFLLATLIVAAACRDLMAPRAAVAAPYLLTDLTGFTGTPSQVNDRGQILSNAIPPAQSSAFIYWYIYQSDAGTLQQLPCGLDAYLNENGEVVCNGQVWENGSLRAIALPDTTVTAVALSRSGEVAGTKQCILVYTNFGSCVVVYWHGQMFQPLPDDESWNPRIADSTGEVVFESEWWLGHFRFNPATGTLTRLDDDAPNFAPAHINASGQIVGTSYPDLTTPRAVYIHGDTTLMLDTANATADYINNRGDIIGSVNGEPVLWPHGAKRISLLHPAADAAWTVSEVYLIDDDGRIVATATHGTTAHTVMLTPSRLPAASALIP